MNPEFNPRPPIRGPWPRRFKWAALAAGIFLIVAEITLRLAFGLGHPLLLEKDSDAGYFYKANQSVTRFGKYSHINGYHQRSGEILEEPPAGFRRVMFIGDSVTFGGTMLDQKETMSSLLSDCAASRGVQVETLNASAGGWALANEFGYLRKYGTFHSSIVIFQIGSHDLVQKKSLPDQVGVQPTMPEKEPVCALSEALFRYAIPTLRSRYSSFEPTALDEPTDEDFAENMALLRDAILKVRGTGARILILHTPNRDEVVAEQGGYSQRYEKFRPRFLELCTKENVPVINLPHDWRGGAEVGGYFRDGVHLSVAGNREIANLICALIIEWEHAASVQTRAPGK